MQTGRGPSCSDNIDGLLYSYMSVFNFMDISDIYPLNSPGSQLAGQLVTNASITILYQCALIFIENKIVIFLNSV